MHHRSVLLTLAISNLSVAVGCTQPDAAADAGSTTTAAAASTGDDAPPQTTTAPEAAPELLTSTDASTTGDPPADEGSSGTTGTTADPALAGECEPGAIEACPYGGPEGTEDVGACGAAARVCKGDARWGACAGEVVPRTEDCRTALDDDCDGESACFGAVDWAWSFGEPAGGLPAQAQALAVASDAAGHVWLTGTFANALQLGDQYWALDEHQSLFLARLDGGGDLGLAFADAQDGANGLGRALAAGPDGAMAIVAEIAGELQIAEQAPFYAVKPETRGAIVGVLEPTGAHRWSRMMRPIGAGEVVIASVAFDAAGNLWAAGSFDGDVNLGTADVPKVLKNYGESDALLVKLTPDGEVAWARGFGDGRAQAIHGVVVDATGDVWIAGGFEGRMEFDGGALHAGVSPTESQDMFVVKLDGAGAWEWGRAYGDEEYQRFNAIALDPAGDAVLLGWYRGEVHNLGAPTMKGAARVVVKFASDGELLWADHWPCEGTCELTSVAVDGAGQVVVGGEVGKPGKLTIEGQTVAGDKIGLGVVIKLDREGKPIWSPRTYPARFAVAVGPLGQIFIAGGFRGALGLGEGDVLQLDTQDAGMDVFVASLRP